MNLAFLWFINLFCKPSQYIYDLIDDDKTGRFILKLVLIELIGVSTTLFIGQFLDSNKLQGYDFYSFKIIVLSAIVAPIIEELIFRSWVRKHNILLSSILFGLAHVFNYHILYWWYIPLVIIACSSQFCGGLVKSMIRVKYGLISAITIHCLWNSIIVGIILFAK